MNEYDMLAKAIVLQAAKDYRSALRRLKKAVDDRKAAATKRECERFFRSDWYRKLTSLDSKVLVQRLKEAAAYDR